MKVKDYFMQTTKTKSCFLVAGIVFIVSVAQSFAVEGLTISIQNGTDVVLGWPSVDGETYIVQGRAAFDTNDPWQTLTNYYPAFSGTNWTTYVITNAITIQNSGGSSGGGSGPPSPNDATIANVTADDSPLTMATGSRLVPPSPWIPASLLHGAILTTSGAYLPLPPPGDGTSAVSDPGFYRVVRNGVHCVGLTNGSVLSATITIPLEIAVDDGDPIDGAALYVDGAAASGGLAQLINGLWTFQWDSTTVPNGMHQLSAEVVFDDYDTFPDVTNALALT
jgi:hypothetical protein